MWQVGSQKVIELNEKGYSQGTVQMTRFHYANQWYMPKQEAFILNTKQKIWFWHLVFKMDQ